MISKPSIFKPSGHLNPFRAASWLNMICGLWILSHTTLFAADEASSAVTRVQAQRVLEFLQSKDPARRAATYKACRDRGGDFKPTYLELLDRAWTHHASEFERTIQEGLAPRTSAAQLIETWRDWTSAADAARQTVQTDHNKEQRKLDEMDRLFADAEKSWKTALRATARLSAGDPVAERMEAHAKSLRELHMERVWADPDNFSDDPMSVADLEDKLSLGTRARDYLDARRGLATLGKELAEAHKTNDAMKWPSSQQKAFARILNERRAVIGLQPLLLDERLSHACYGHSEEMERLGYFSHTSPVAENQTFTMRAQRAEFTGSASGECIHAGSTDPASAERSWWYSCGHRVINYASGPNTLGIGIHNQHWTLNTGSVSR